MTTSRVDPPNRITVAWAAALVFLCLVAFVLAAGEAWAAEQPPQTAQQGMVETTTIINGQVAEPVFGTTMPVDTQPVEKPPVEDTAPSPPKNEAPPAEEPSPPPVDAAPSASGPDLAPQWFAVVLIDGKVVESDPMLTSGSGTHLGQVLEPEPMPNASPDVLDPAPAPAPPAATDDGYAPGPTPDPMLLPVPGPAAASELVLPAAPWGDDGPPPPPANAAPVDEGVKPAARPVSSVPASVGEALPLPSSLGATAASAVGTVRSAAASAASATAEVLGALAGGSPGTTSYDNSADGNRGQPSEGMPQPAPPVAPPGGGSSFSPSTGGGQMGTGGGFAPLLMGILALLAVILLGRDFRTYLVSCEVPKPSSALLQPLERPG
jgi:hypothetical protein